MKALLGGTSEAKQDYQTALKLAEAGQRKSHSDHQAIT